MINLTPKDNQKIIEKFEQLKDTTHQKAEKIKGKRKPSHGI